jgi:opacity protein-like surface antigen
MKRLSVVFVLLFLVMSVGQAQKRSGFEVFLSSGFAIPSSPMPFANYWKMQYGGGGGVGYTLSSSITILGSAEYYKFQLNRDGISKSFDTKYMSDIWIFNDVSLNPSADPSSVFTASINLQLTPSGNSKTLSPYLLLGAGVMSVTLSEISLPTTSVLALDSSIVSMTAMRRITGGKETAAFFQCGMGIEAHLTSLVTMFAEARFVRGLSKGLGTAYIPLTAGVKITL